MQVISNPKTRKALYVATVLLTPLVMYLRAINMIGDLEMALWAGEVTAVSGLAALNTDTSGV